MSREPKPHAEAFGGPRDGEHIELAAGPTITVPITPTRHHLYRLTLTGVDTPPRYEYQGEQETKA